MEKNIFNTTKVVHFLLFTPMLVLIVFGVIFVRKHTSLFSFIPKAKVLYTSEGDVYSKEKTEAKEEIKKDYNKVLFVGDIMLGRYVEKLMLLHGEKYPFEKVSSFLKGYTVVGNLEGPIPATHRSTVNGGMLFSFPNTTPRILKENAIAAVSLANNHAYDQSESGYENTKIVLDKEGVGHFGGYSTTVLDSFATKVSDVPVVVYGITMISSTWNKEEAYKATEMLRKENKDAILVAFVHWGNEYSSRQGDAQKEFAHVLIDKGVDVIVGSHPHVVQGIEVYKSVPIFYSLGNFIFDQYFSKEVQRGYVLSLDKQEGFLVYGITPIVSSYSQPSIASEKERKEIVGMIAKSSDNFLQKSIFEGSIIVPFRKR